MLTIKCQRCGAQVQAKISSRKFCDDCLRKRNAERMRQSRVHERRMPADDSLFSRECHDCKKPTTQYRCPQCHEEWRRKHGVPEDACGEDIYLGALMPEYFL